MSAIDPHKPSNTDLNGQNRKSPKLSIFYLVSSMLLLILALLSLYGALFMHDEREDYEHLISQIDELSHKIETQELTLKRETLLEYFKNNKAAVEDEHEQMKNSGTIIFIIGVVLLVISIFQIVIFYVQYRKA